MKNFNLIVGFFAMLLFTFVIGCGDKDNQEIDDTPVVEVACDPECNTETHECKLVGEKATCVKKEVTQVVCDPACGDNQECVCEDNEAGDHICVCKDKQVEEPVTPMCDPACGDNQECVCEDTSCVCEDVSVEESLCDGKAENDQCGDNKTCQLENENIVCKDVATEEPTQPGDQD
jgi:hypothetical protein